jgi:hypothetical protein
MIEPTYFLSVISAVAVGSAVFLRCGPGPGVGAAMAISLLVPTWVMLRLGGVPLDVRLVTAAVLVTAYCFHPSRRFVSRPTVIDVALLGLLAWHIASDMVHEGSKLSIPLRAYGEWALPFVAGWFAVIHRGSIAVLAPWFAGAACVTASLALSESLMGVNVWELVFGDVDDLVVATREQRYGLLHRALGPTRHPIFLGIVLALFVPWAVALIDPEQRRRDRIFGTTSLVVIILGVVATMSRGPLLGLLLAAIAAACFYWSWARRVFAVAAVLGAIAALTSWSSLVAFLDRTEDTQTYGSVIEVDGQMELYTGTRNRLYVMEIYGPLVLRGGMFGFGTAAVSSFPPNIPGLPVSARSREILGIVDNSFILVGLRFGAIGLGLLTVLLTASVFHAFSLAKQESLVTFPSGPGFLLSLASILVGVSAVMLTVFSSYEFIFWVMFTCGVVSGLVSLDTKIRRGELRLD